MSELAELIARRDEVLAELQEIESLSADGVDRILDAVKAQRWYFFRNNKYILMDRDTGILWANLDYNEEISLYNYERFLIENSKISGWEDGYDLISDNTRFYADYPFIDSYDDDYIYCSRSLVVNTTYSQDVDPNNKIYSERERLQFTLDLFTRNNLWPKFNNDEITNLFGRLYIDKPQLTAELQQLNEQIAPLMAVRVLSSEFNYTDILAKYDLNAIASSVIKYFQALRNWTDELMTLIENYEHEKLDTISQFNTITLTLSKRYTDSPDLTSEENTLLRERQEFFRKRLSLDMHTVKAKLLAVKSQADSLEDRLDFTDSITELTAISREDRAAFPLIAENTARILMQDGASALMRRRQDRPRNLGGMVQRLAGFAY